jgi:hypothetical protein
MAEQTNENVAQTTNEPQAKYTDADVDAIINKKFASWQEKQDKAIAEAVAKVEEANRLAQMNDKEKADHERKQMEDELASLKAEKAHHTMMSQARQMLKADGLTIPDEIVSVLVTDTAEGTSDAVKAFSGMFQKAVENAVREKLAGSEPKKGTASAMSKEEILSIKDRATRLKAIEENLDLFQNK